MLLKWTCDTKGSGLFTLFTLFTLLFYTVDMVCTVDTVHTVYTIETAKTIACMPIYIVGKLRTLLELANELLSKMPITDM